MTGSIHLDNIRIRNQDSRNSHIGNPDNQIQFQHPQFRLKFERQNVARERKPIHLPPVQLREAFSCSFSLPVCCFARDESSCQELPRRSECAASLYNIIGCGPSRGSQKMAKTEAVPTKGIADRLVSTDRTKRPHWLHFLLEKSKIEGWVRRRSSTTNDSGHQPSPLTNNRSSCRNCMPYRYSSGNSCRSSDMRVGLPQTQSRKSPPQESKREFWCSFSYSLSLLMQPRLAPSKR